MKSILCYLNLNHTIYSTVCELKLRVQHSVSAAGGNYYTERYLIFSRLEVLFSKIYPLLIISVEGVTFLMRETRRSEKKKSIWIGKKF